MAHFKSLLCLLVVMLLTSCSSSSINQTPVFPEWRNDLGAVQPVMHEGIARLLYSKEIGGVERLVSFDRKLNEESLIDTGNGSVREAVFSTDGATIYCVVVTGSMYEVRRCGVAVASAEILFESPQIIGGLVANANGSQLALCIGNPVVGDDPVFRTSIHTLDLATQKLTRLDAPPRIYQYPIAWNDAGEVIYATSIDGRHYDVRSWNPKSGADASLRTVDVSSTSAVYVDPQITRAAYLGAAFAPEASHHLVVFDLDSGAEIFAQVYDYVSGVKFSEAGNLIAFREVSRDHGKSRIHVVDLRRERDPDVALR
jgi:hypothetical protein